MEINKMGYSILYHPDVKKIDLPKIDQKRNSSIKVAIETRLSTKPHIYGRPLQRTLKSYWELRVGAYRIVYKINHDEIIILEIIHRKTGYTMIQKRAG
ncbi:MAG: type II toxin-antitoxin system RelE family toxin [Nitrospinales bacterium]